MSREFLPEYSALPVGNQYRPMFRLYRGTDWRMVVGKGGVPVYCETFSQAVSVAKDTASKVMNPKTRAFRSDDMGAAAWKAGKQERQAELIANTFKQPYKFTVEQRKKKRIKQHT